MNTANQSTILMQKLLTTNNAQEYTKGLDEQMDSDDIEIIGEVVNNVELKKRQDSSIAEAKKEAGNALYKQSRYYDALKLYTEAIVLCPDVAAYYGNRCACYMMLGKYQLALKDAVKSVSIDDKFIKGYIRKLKCHIALGDIELAELTLKKMSELNEEKNVDYIKEKENIAKIMKLRSDVQRYYDQKNDYKLLLHLLKTLLNLTPSCNKYHLMKVECLIELNEYKEAQDLVSTVLKDDQMSADGYFLRGLTLYYQDNAEKALNHFQQALRLSPEHINAKTAYKKVKLLITKKEEGNNAYTGNKLDEAYEIYTFALGIDPKNASMNAKLYFNRAVVSAKKKNFNGALEDCNNAIKLDSNYMKAFLKRARLYMDLEMYEEAVREYQRLYQQERKHELKTLLHDAQVALKKSKRKDYYKILGVSKNASEDEIKKAYRKRAMLHHPDRHSAASDEVKREQERKFKELGEAYGVLTDPKKKSRYDNGIDIDDLCGSGGGGHGCNGFPDMEANIFNLFTGHGGTQGAFPNFTFQHQGFHQNNQNPFHFFQ